MLINQWREKLSFLLTILASYFNRQNNIVTTGIHNTSFTLPNEKSLLNPKYTSKTLSQL